MTYPQAIGRQLDRCDRCGKKVHKKDLFRTQVEFATTVGENLFSYSTYEGTFWTTNPGSSQGSISIGPYANSARCRVANDGTVSQIGGSPTFAAATINVQVETSDSMDLSSYTSLVFSAIVGPYHGNTSRVSMSVEIGFKEGSNTHYRTWSSVDSMTRVWIYTTLSTLQGKGLDITTVKPYVKMTPGSISKLVFIEDLQLESNVTSLGNFIRTTGSPITRAVPTRSMVIEKLCHECSRIKILKRSTQRGNIPQETEQEPPTYLQEI